MGLSYEYLYYLCAVLLALLVLAILTTNTISFVNSQRVRAIRNSFKKELFECIREQIPEIKDYCYYHKIHPKYFNDSGLYKSAHSDYIGDDLFLGNIKGSKFEICEFMYSIFSNKYLMVFSFESY